MTWLRQSPYAHLQLERLQRVLEDPRKAKVPDFRLALPPVQENVVRLEVPVRYPLSVQEIHT